MNKFIGWLLVPFSVLVTLNYLQVQKKEDLKQKTVLALDTRKVLDHLMVDLSQARESTMLDLPADGMWHDRLAFQTDRSGALEYVIRKRNLFRINNGASLLIADNIADMRIRRQRTTPGILEVQVKAQMNASLLSNLKIRIRE